MANSIDKNSVELDVGVNILMEYPELLEQLANEDTNSLKLDIDAGNIDFSTMLKQIVAISKGEGDIVTKTKEMTGVINNGSTSSLKILQQLNKQLIDGINKDWERAQNALKKNNIVEYNSLLETMKARAEITESISRQIDKNFGTMNQIKIADIDYDPTNLSDFKKYLNEEQKAYKDFTADIAQTKKQLTNLVSDTQQKFLKSPVVSTMAKNAIASLGQNFKTLEKDINKDVNQGNYDEIEKKIVELANYKAAINELMDTIGIESISASENSKGVSIKKDTKYGINTLFNNLISTINTKAPEQIKKQVPIFQEIGNSVSKTNEKVLELIQNIYKVNNINNTSILKKSSSIPVNENKVTALTDKDTENLDIALDSLSAATKKEFDFFLKDVIEQYNKIAQKNYNEAANIFTQKLKEYEFIDEDQNISDFEELYQENIKKTKTSLYKPNIETNKGNNSDNFVNNTFSSTQENMETTNQKIEQAMAEKNELQAELQNKDAEIVKLNKEISNIHQRMNDLRNQLNQASNNTNLSETDQLKEEVKKLNSDLDSKKKEITNLSAQIKQLKDTTFTTDEIKNSEEHFAEINTLQQKLTQTEKKLIEVQKLNEQLSSKASSDNSATDNVQKLADMIQKYDDTLDEKGDGYLLEDQKKDLEAIINLHSQLNTEQKSNNVLKNVSSIEYIRNQLSGVTEDIYTINEEHKKEIQTANEAEIKKTELYQEIIDLQKKYKSLLENTDGSKLGLDNRNKRADILNKYVNGINNKKKRLQSQYPDQTFDELWSDEQIKEAKENAQKRLTGLTEKRNLAEIASLKFVRDETKAFEDYCKEYESAKTLKEKNNILKHIDDYKNTINNTTVPIGQATEKDLKSQQIATQEAINEVVAKFENYLDTKRTEILELMKEATESGKVIDQAKNNSKIKSTVVSTPVSEPKTSISSTPSVPQALMGKKITSSADFINTIQKNKKNNVNKKASEEEVANLNGAINSLQIKDIIVTKEAKNKLEDELINIVNPVKISTIEFTNNATENFNTAINNALGTIYISDVKLGEDVTLSKLQQDITAVINNNPIAVNIVPNISNNIEDQEEKQNSAGVAIDISAISFTDENVVSTIKAKIEEALSPIFIKQINADEADTTSLDNRISLALNTVTIERVVLNENFDIAPLQDQLEKRLNQIKISKIDAKDFAQSIKAEVDKTLKGLKSPEFEVKAKITDNEEKQFNKLTQTINKVEQAIQKKNAAIVDEIDLVDAFLPDEINKFKVLAEQIANVKTALGSIKKIKIYFEEEEKKKEEKPDVDNKAPVKKRKKEITGNVDIKDDKTDKVSTNTNQIEEDSIKKITINTAQKNKLLEEEFLLKSNIVKIDKQIVELEKNTNINQKEKDNKIQDLKEKKKKLETDLQEQQSTINSTNISNQDRKNYQDSKQKKIYADITKEQDAINKYQKIIGPENTASAQNNYKQIVEAVREYEQEGQKTIDTLAKLNATTYEVIKTNKQLRISIKNSSGLSNLDSQYERLITKMKKWANSNPLAMRNTGVLNEYNEIMRQLSDTSKRTSDGINQLESRFSKLDGQIQDVGLTGRTFTGEIKNLFNVFGNRAIAGMAVEGVKNALRQMVDNVKEIDSAMTELKKVTNETSAAYNNFLKEAGSRAEVLGSTMTDLIESTANFAKLGFNLKDASSLAENAIMYSNVGDLDIETATNDIVSAMKAFRIEASDAIKIVDSFNEVGNNYAVSAQQIGEALQNSASSLVVAGNDIDQSIAMITAMTEITQDAASAGAALRTLSLRIRGAKTELSDLGESTDDMAVSTAKLRDKIKGMTGVDIMIDDNNFKSTYQIIQEISKVWDELKDIDRSAVLELLAGMIFLPEYVVIHIKNIFNCR